MSRKNAIIMPKKKQSHDDVASQFSDQEMDQIKRYGQALGGQPTAFDQEVEEHLAGMEKNAAKMRAAQTGGSGELGQTEMDQTAITQRGALDQQSDTQAAQQAVQAQGAQAPVNAPPAPTGPQGETVPYTAQKGAVGGSGPTPQPAPPPAAPPAPAGPQEPPPDQEEPS